MFDSNYHRGDSSWWAAITRRYKTRPGPASSLDLRYSGLVVPTLNVDRLLDRSRVPQYATAVAGAGAFIVFTVPRGKRWLLHAYSVMPNATGNYTAQLGIASNVAGETQVFLGAAVLATAETHVNFGTPLPMEQGYSLYLTVTAFVAAGGAIRYTFLVTEEDMAGSPDALLAY